MTECFRLSVYQCVIFNWRTNLKLEFMFNLLDILRLNKEKRAENPPNNEYVLSSNIVITKNIVEESDKDEENNC